jgi:hypothetical protein
MNHSIATADGHTHIKIAALAMVAAIVVVVVGFSAKGDNSGDNSETGATRATSNVTIIKAGQATKMTTRSGIEIR